MKYRCLNSNDSHYHCYGGRGIRVCDEWVNSFEAFARWAFANGWKSELTIERKNNNGNYEPDNCRWASQTEQANNKSTNHILEAFGEKKTMAEWSRDQRCAVSYDTLWLRIDRSNWLTEEAIATPPQ